eukprot:5013607-Ditylum_brightwellii.AAC.1
MTPHIGVDGNGCINSPAHSVEAVILERQVRVLHPSTQEGHACLDVWSSTLTQEDQFCYVM